MHQFDVLVIGSGPAGATAARLLASWGYQVGIMERSDSRPRPERVESLPPSIRRLFAQLEIRDAIDRCDFPRASGNTSWWADETARVELFHDRAGATGYQVPRTRFDRLLVDLALSAGAQRLEAGARRVRIANGLAYVDGLTPAGRQIEVVAQFVLDCSGRAGVVARHGFRRDEVGYRTLSITGVWRTAVGWPLPHSSDPTHTLVETWTDGWAWSVPLSNTTRCFTVMIDPRFTATTARGLDATYREQLSKAGQFQRLLARAIPVGQASSCDASIYAADRYVDSQVLLVGDAASFIDPLSSFGIKKAMASAWRAAAVVNTCLQRPERRACALELFERREHDVYARYLQQSRPYFAQAAECYRHSFWCDRASVAAAADNAKTHGTEIREDELRQDPDVLKAFSDLRTSQAIRLRRGPHVKVQPTPQIAGREVVMEDVLVTRALPGGVRFLGGVNLPRLLEIAPDHTQVPDLFDAYNRSARAVTLPNFLGALSVMVAKGVLDVDP